MQATLTILGSGTLLPNEARHSAAHLVEVGSTRILMDCGSGTLHGFSRHGVQWDRLTHVVVTHYHSDHIGDLYALLFALKYGLGTPREEPLTLVGPVGFRAFLDRLLQVRGPEVLDTSFQTTVVELAAGDVLRDDRAGISLTCHSTPHTSESVAYRLDLGGAVVGYTGDTGPSEGVAEFLRGCDVLVSECALTDPPEWDLHLSPVGVAEIASVAEPGLLVLTHVYPPLEPEDAAGQVTAAGYGGRVLAAKDGLRLALGGE
jgi:ribonuclease BN (tRNA processing enzyme)